MRKRRNHGGAVVEFALVFPMLCSLIIGTMMYGVGLLKELELEQVARDTASMLARGTDFTDNTNQLIVARLGQTLGWPTTGLPTSSGVGVVYISTVEYLDATCNGVTPVCANAGNWVFTASVMIGDKNFRKSNIGAQPQCVPGCYDTSQVGGALLSDSILTNPQAIATNFTALNQPGVPSTTVNGFQPGQVAYVVEAAATTGGWGAGTVGYAFAIF
jgi:hypothetical protein